MWKCPVCGRENEGNTICFNCSWNSAKDYSRYATVCPVGKVEKELASESLCGTEYLMKRAAELQKKEQWGEAIPFYEKAAEKGNLEAMKCLGRCFWGGLGTEKNLYKALYWYCRIMIDKKQDVSLLMDNLYEEIKSDRVKQENRLPGEDKTIVSSFKTKHALDSNYFSEVSKEVSKKQIQNIFIEKSLPQDPSVKTHSVSSDGSVRFWLKKDLKSDRYDLYIGAEGGVDAPEDCCGLFVAYPHVQKIVFQDNFRTQDVKDMSGMFLECRELQTLDLSTFDTGKVTNMSQMFSNCQELQTLNLGTFDTGKVTDMSLMFSDCKKLQTLDLSSFETGKVTNMSYMFSNCQELQTLNLSSFDTGKVTDMSCMFDDCWKLRTLDLSSFDTGKVTDMSCMFDQCAALQTLDLSNFNIENVTEMSEMFYGCERLKKLNLGNFNTKNGDIDSSLTNEDIDISLMFEKCDQLENIFYSGTEDIEQLKKDFEIFGDLRSDLADRVLKKSDPVLDNFSYIDKSNRTKQEDRLPGGDEKGTIVSTPKTRHVLDRNYFSAVGKEVTKNQIQNIFFENSLSQDPSVKTYSISSDGSVRFWLKRDLKTYSYDLYIGAEGGVDAPEYCDGLFAGYHYVQKIVFQNNFRTQDVRDMSYMFHDCRELKNLDVSSFNTAKVTKMSNMFYGCKRLAELDLGDFNTRNVTDMSGMFFGCDQLETIFYSGTESIERIKEKLEMSGNLRLDLANRVLKKAASVLDNSSYIPNISQENSGKREPILKKNWILTDPNELNKDYFSALKGKIRKDQIKSIIFEDELPKNSSVQTYTVSPEGSVKLWLGDSNTSFGVQSQLLAGGIDLHIGAGGGVDAPEDCSGLFEGFTNVKSIVFQNNFRTQNVKNMSQMFYACWNLQELDISGFDSEQVTDMSRMFLNCAQLEKIDLRRLNTSNVENMSWMFFNCKQLKTLDFNGFDTKKVKNMSYMFGSCESLTELDLSMFNTQNVTTMRSMFGNCTSLKTLNLSNFDTRNVTGMNRMFAGCSQLDTYLGERLDTQNADKKDDMFLGCRPEIKKAILGN